VPLPRLLALHGHFYQPPRENPWLEAVEVQDSAAPHHDWNDRVSAECYAPNTAARRLDAANRIVNIVNNFEKISFNVGPTLIAWLARHRPETYAKILEADRTSVGARGGHGNAIAQVYNHMIMPLATRRDKVTQVRWGIDDFRARFGREPEGLWLPETAVDGETLEVLAEAGIRFAILAPHQAWRVRRLDTATWDEVGERVDPSRAYRWRGPRGLGLALFFYDGPVSRAIAFENLLESGEKVVARLQGAFSDARDWPQLVHCATDGESYGHHSRFGDMALASAVERVEADPRLTLTNYGAFLAAHPPTHEVQIRERTSWSCPHGVERWRADCGCRMDPGSQQRWRAPLREALDWLRDEIDTFFEVRGGKVLRDPWAARDAYIHVILDRRPDRLEEFFATHLKLPLDAAGHVEVRQLLEMERNRLLMYTSCGWFFDDIGGLEPVQNIKYAAMALQYLRELGGNAVESDFVKRLATAPSNGAGLRDGGEIYRRLVRPATVDLRRVVAHYAITGLFERYPDDATVHAYRVLRLDEAHVTRDGTALRVAHVRVTSEITGDAKDATYAVLHFGAQDLTCGVRSWEDRASYDELKSDLIRRYDGYSMADVVRGLDRHFPHDTFSFTHLFLDERRRFLAAVLEAVIDRHEATLRHIWEESRTLARYLREADAPVPDTLAMVARHVLEQEALAVLDDAAAQGAIPDRLFELMAEAARLGLTLDLASARPTMHRAVAQALAHLAAGPTPARVSRVLVLIEGASRLGIRYGRWALQNRFFELWQADAEARPILEPLAHALGFALTAGAPGA
jgi:alpha-amylase/alpha-mannosidase (GH57 family)